jgi:putative endopeptidase
MSMRALRRCSLALVLLAPCSALGAQAPSVLRPALDPANVDRTFRACDDFYMFANNGWIEKNPIPAAFASWGSFSDLTERNGLVLRDVIEHAARQAPATTEANTRRLGTFYTSCMDSTAADAAGAAPLQPELARIAAIADRAALRAQVARLHRLGTSAAFSFGSGSDAKNSTMVIAQTGQGGTTLPDRDYYLRTDSTGEATRARYLAHITAMLTLAGEPPADAAANAVRVLSLETALARASLPRVAMRDPRALYHPMTLAEADTLMPGWSWAQFARDVALPALASMNVATPAFFRALGPELSQRPLEDWRAYLRWVVISRNADVLSTPFVNESFAFNASFSGARTQQPRWKRCLATADATLGDALGQEYVKVAFAPDAKSRMLEMVRTMREVLRERIAKVEWMSEPTRIEALRKMDSFHQKIGYPETWRDYAELDIRPGAFVDNVLAVRASERRRGLAMIGRPVDRARWGMTPPTVNAYYSPPLNEIVFPAGRLQPPFFSTAYDDAANYGGVGATIGHEMSHGFDDSGRQYDAAGTLRDWWTPEDARRYTERAAVVVRQYDEYIAVDTIHVNGRLTLGENLADIVGVSVAYEALQRSRAGKPYTPIDGFTPDQRFFLAWGQARLGVNRPERARVAALTDTHAPGKYRVNGPLANMPEFARAFGCRPGDRMVRPDSLRVHIW